MNPNKPTKPIVAILKDASSCADLYSSIRDGIKKLKSMSDKSKQIRDAYSLLRNTRTAITQYGPTKSLMAIVNKNGELAHAIHVDIPKITTENKQQVVKDIVDGIDHVTENLIDRLKIYSKENADELNKLTDAYIQLAVNQKSVLCDLRQHISAIDYNEQNAVADTKLCGCSKENFSNRVSALRTLHRSLTSKWADWSRHGLTYALDKFGYKLVVDCGEDLDPEEQPEEPLDPEMVVVPKGDVEEGSDTPVPDSEIDPSEVTPSVETPPSESMQNLGWSRKTMLDSINSLIAAVDKTKELSAMKECISSSLENLGNAPDLAGDYRACEKTVLSSRTYYSVCDEILTIYGRELNHLVNDTINLVVRLHGYLGRKS